MYMQKREFIQFVRELTSSGAQVSIVIEVDNGVELVGDAKEVPERKDDEDSPV